eukprot:g24709.t1
MEDVVYVLNVGRKCLVQGGENGVKVGSDEFGGAEAYAGDGSARVIGLVDLGEQVKPGSAGLGDYKAAGSTGEVTRSDEVMDSVEDGDLMGHGGVVVKSIKWSWEVDETSLDLDLRNGI